MTDFDTRLIGRATTPDAKRVIMERLLAVWLRTPSLRLAQLINAFGDPFYVEDEKLCERLEERFPKESRDY